MRRQPTPILVKSQVQNKPCQKYGIAAEIAAFICIVPSAVRPRGPRLDPCWRSQIACRLLWIARKGAAAKHAWTLYAKQLGSLLVLHLPVATLCRALDKRGVCGDLGCSRMCRMYVERVGNPKLPREKIAVPEQAGVQVWRCALDRDRQEGVLIPGKCR